MAAWNSSSLAASDGKGIFKTTKSKKSKQDKMTKMMFGHKGGKAPLGKKFMKKGKGVGSKTSVSAKGIGPSEEEFDNMMTDSSKTPKKGASRKFFS